MNRIVTEQNHLRLTEVDFIRPVLIILLVVYHAFIIYSGGWHEPAGFEPSTVYAWIAKSSYSFMLETFVFISGYIFMFQIVAKNRYQNWGG